MTKRIFRAIFAAAMAVLLAVLLFTLGAVHAYFTGVQLKQLQVETALAAHAVAREGQDYFAQLDGMPDCRITWVRADGTVLYDSRSAPEDMENHLERQEVRTALETGYAQSARYSHTLMARSLYAAQRLPDGTVLRLSTSQDSLLSLALGMSGSIGLILAAAVLLSYCLARRLAQKIVKPLNELDLDAPLQNTHYAEIRPLLLRLDSQQRQLRAQEVQLKQKQREFQTVTRSLSEGLVLLSSTGIILSINPAAASVLEITPHCLGADFSVANRNAAIAALVARALAGSREEQTVELSAGTYLAAANPVRTEDGISGVALLLFDVTRKQEAERLRREFTANVSHELKTPLHAISGYAELMQTGMVSPADMPRFSGKIYAEAQRMIRLVEDILRLSRLDEGAADLPAESIDLYACAQRTLRELAGAGEKAGVALRLEGGRAVVQGAAQLVSGILFNLTDNAIKYNRPGGSVTVTVAEDAGGAVLTVADTGIGIPEAYRERVFERFYRVDKSHSKEVGGTGLGLSIVKHAALVLGAAVHLESAPGAGTTVTVCFPKGQE